MRDERDERLRGNERQSERERERERKKERDREGERSQSIEQENHLFHFSSRVNDITKWPPAVHLSACSHVAGLSQPSLCSCENIYQTPGPPSGALPSRPPTLGSASLAERELESPRLHVGPARLSMKKNNNNSRQMEGKPTSPLTTGRAGERRHL